jgi:hypothetical protein
VNHFASPNFWDAYRRLPERVRNSADASFARLKSDPRHPSLHLKQIGHYWSVRVGLHYRALAIQDGEDLVWFWIGSHAEYDRLLGS